MDKPTPGAGLADRFRKAVAAEQQARRDAEAAAKKVAEEARRLQDQLLVDLGAFGRALGFLGVESGADHVQLAHEGRQLRFTRAADGAVEVALGATKAMVYREAQLGDRWVVVIPRRGRDQRMPLFDQGLEELLVQGLGLPRPDGGVDPTT